MNLNFLQKQKGTKAKKKRYGQGYGSGKGGHTSGRGMKGQRARSRRSLPFAFEGGQIPLYKRLPQIGGFRSHTAKDIIAVSLSTFNIFKDGEEVTPQSLIDKKIFKKLPKYGIKVLDKGKIEKKVVLKGFLASESAKKAIEKAGAKLS